MWLSDDERDRVAALRVMVVEGVLPPGEPRRYVDLAGVLGTDAAGVAAAVRELGRDGFVEPLSDGTFRVVPGAHEDVDDLVAIRLLVEPAALRQAAACARAVDLISLRELAALVGEACRRAAFEDYYEATEGFFTAWLSLLPNRLLADLVVDLRRRTRLDGARQILEAGLRSDVEPAYLALIGLIEAGDLDGVEAAARGMLERLRYVGAPRRDRGESLPFLEEFPADALPFEVDDFDDVGW